LSHYFFGSRLQALQALINLRKCKTSLAHVYDGARNNEKGDENAPTEQNA
jgi:hypothetical protein